LGGVILIENGKVKVHVVKPSLTKIPIKSEKELGNLVHYIEISPPLVGAGCIVSHDPVILKIILIHIPSYLLCGSAKYFSNFLGNEVKTSTFPPVL